MEEDWVGPWTFLFPGNIQDVNLIVKIQTLLDDISREPVFRGCVNDVTRGVIYKLIENFNCLSLDLKKKIQYLLADILDTPMSSEVIECSVKIAELGATIRFDSPRNPTILVLDQVFY